jgi:hypothetical protein
MLPEIEFSQCEIDNYIIDYTYNDECARVYFSGTSRKDVDLHPDLQAEIY